MKKRLLIISVSIFISLALLVTFCYAERPYKSILVITNLILNEKGTALKPDLPFKTYAQNCVMEGKDITYRMNDLKNVGKEVLCKVDYRAEPHQNPDILVEKEIAEAFAGNIGQDWSKLKTDVRYIKHYNVQKKDAFATYDELGNKTEYDGADKDEFVKFTQWEEDKEVEGNGGYIFSQ